MESSPLSFKQLMRTADRIDPSGAVAAKMIEVYVLIRHVYRVGPAAAIMAFRGIGITDTKGIALPNAAYEQWAFQYSPDHITYILNTHPDWAGAVADAKDYVVDLPMIHRTRWRVMSGWADDMIKRYIFDYRSRGAAAADERVVRSVGNIIAAAGGNIDLDSIRRRIPRRCGRVFANLVSIAIRPIRWPGIYCLTVSVALTEMRRAPTDQTFFAEAESFLDSAMEH